MAEWKKIIFEDSLTSLKSLAAERDSDATSGNIEGNFALFGVTDNSTGGSGALSVVISGSGAGLEITSSDAFASALTEKPLSFQPAGGIDGSNGSTQFNGQVARSLFVDTASLSGNGMLGGDNTMNITAGNNISVGGSSIAVNATMADADKGLKVFGTSIGIHTGSGMSFQNGGATGTTNKLIKLAPNAGGVTGAALAADSFGIDFSNAAGFNYGTDRTVSVDVSDFVGNDTGLEDDGSNNIRVSGSNLLGANTGSKWTGTAFNKSSIHEATSTLTIDSANVVAGGARFSVAGTANYAHESDVEIADRFLLINSSSANFGNNARFGFIGNGAGDSATGGISLFYSGSAGDGATDNGWMMGVSGDFPSDEPGATKGRVRLHIGEAEGSPNTLTFNSNKVQAGNSFFDTGDVDDGFYIYT